MRRREFITLIGGAAASWPLKVRAQQANNVTIGYFSGRSSNSEGLYKVSFHKGLEEAGYVEGQNVTIEYRFSDGHDDRLPVLAADLIRQHVTLLVATDGPSALAAHAATKTIPIVFSTGGDPVKLGSLKASTDRTATPRAYMFSSQNWDQNVCSYFVRSRLMPK